MIRYIMNLRTTNTPPALPPALLPSSYLSALIVSVGGLSADVDGGRLAARVLDNHHG
jgi:hypothetical protein